MSLRVVLIISIALCSADTHAWNALGHKVVAEIAWRELEPSARQQIVDVVRRHPRFDADFAQKMTDDVLKGDKALQDRWVFQHAATWPDIARNLPKGERSKYDRPQWHYVDFPLFLDGSDQRALAGKLSVNLATDFRTTKDKRQLNVLQAIGYARATVESSAGADTKALAYCWLLHLVGDVHQPCHSTALFCVNHFPDGEGDRGGNEIPLARGDDLHSLWDNLLGRQHFIRDVDKTVLELKGQQRFRDVLASAAKEREPRGWAKESHELCKAFVYDRAILEAVRATPAGSEIPKVYLPDPYYKEAGDHARRRIVAAGVRLGKVLRGDVSARLRTTTAEAFDFESAGVATTLAPQSATPTGKTAELTYWLNTKSNSRHNSRCKWYGKTKHGRYCTAEEGKPCGECGG
jgi:hypothetical protein